MDLVRALRTPTMEVAGSETIEDWYSAHVNLRNQSHSTTTGMSDMAFRVLFVDDVQHATLWDNEQMMRRQWWSRRVDCDIPTVCGGPYTADYCACSRHTLHTSPASCTTTRIGGTKRQPNCTTQTKWRW